MFLTPKQKAERERRRERSRRIDEALAGAKRAKTFEEMVVKVAAMTGEPREVINYELQKRFDHARQLLSWQAYEAGVEWSEVADKFDRGYSFGQIVEALEDKKEEQIVQDAMKFRRIKAAGRRGADIVHTPRKREETALKYQLWRRTAAELREKFPRESTSAIAERISRRFEHTEFSGGPNTVRRAIRSRF